MYCVGNGFPQTSSHTLHVIVLFPLQLQCLAKLIKINQWINKKKQTKDTTLQLHPRHNMPKGQAKCVNELTLRSEASKDKFKEQSNMFTLLLSQAAVQSLEMQRMTLITVWANGTAISGAGEWGCIVFSVGTCTGVSSAGHLNMVQ